MIENKNTSNWASSNSRIVVPCFLNKLPDRDDYRRLNLVQSEATLSTRRIISMSNSYEMMYILRPDLSEEQVGESINKYKNYLSENGADNIEIQVRGKRRLAYLIDKYLDGIYVQMNYQADGTQIAPLERRMRLSEDVIRYLSLKLKKRAAVVTENLEVSEPTTEIAEEQTA